MLKDIDITNKVVLIKKDSIIESMSDEKNRLFYCTSGFGCSPVSRGSAVMGFHLNNSETTRWERNDVQKVMEMTDEYKERIKQIEEHKERQKNTCYECGKHTDDGVELSGTFDVISGQMLCKDCERKDDTEDIKRRKGEDRE